MVKIWQELVSIPTYETGQPDSNPMFYEKRVYQGSSGKVYPLPVIDKIMDTPVSKDYQAVFMENDYINIMVLPSLGGRIQRALDKTNQYDFIYYNEVIKPALVGLAGPWVSGGIEFNWPQHHRPSTFSPVEYTMTEEAGKVILHISEIDEMYGTRAYVKYVLHDKKAYLEIEGCLHNRTDYPQTFLWWANPAVSVNDHTQSIFPPDVTAVYDHGKRDVSSFPIATGTYYKVDYSQGVDISRYANIPVPTSYMAYRSAYDFIGGYDYQKECGMLHVANHHLAPGKKQWTWGHGDFGQAWDRNLTDHNGPYVELMTGVFTDNQPDFTWMGPHESKHFKQYFLPYKKAGQVKNATKDLVLHADVHQGLLHLVLYASSQFEHLAITVTSADVIIRQQVDIVSPVDIFERKLPFQGLEDDYEIIIKDHHGRILLSYTRQDTIEDMPKPAKACPKPSDVRTNDELFFIATHLEQYRHATYRPEDYYLEGLKRDPGDVRLNVGYGKHLSRQGLYAEALTHFDRSLQRLMKLNERPYDGEPLYFKALALKHLMRMEEAYETFYKAVWSQNTKSSAYFQLALIKTNEGAAKRRRQATTEAESSFQEALGHLEEALVNNQKHARAHALKLTLTRILDRHEQAFASTIQMTSEDGLNFAYQYESYRLGLTSKEVLTALLRNSLHNYLELAGDYATAGLYEEAAAILDIYDDQMNDAGSPLCHYHQAWYQLLMGHHGAALSFIDQAESKPAGLVFPNKLDTQQALEACIETAPKALMAKYHLGNFYYDRRVYDHAIDLWSNAIESGLSYPTVYRNLAIAHYNKRGHKQEALDLYIKAFDCDHHDARILYELDQLKKHIDIHPRDRLAFLNKHLHLVQARDDLYLEYATLHNLTDTQQEAATLLANRHFHVWEGGEGKVAEQYVIAHLGLAKALLTHHPEKALDHLEQCLHYPDNLGEGRLEQTPANHIDYYKGLAYQRLGKTSEAKKSFEKATQGLTSLSIGMFYNDQPGDTIFFQGMACLSLSDHEGAHARFDLLERYADQHINDHVEIDYFAVSLPNHLIFDDDLDARNKQFCTYLKALAIYGKKSRKEGQQHYHTLIERHPNFQALFDFKED